MRASNIKLLKYIVPILAISAIFACKKLENDALNTDNNLLTTSLNIKVINDKKNQPEPGVKVYIGRKITAKGQYQIVDTVRTNTSGEFAYNAPYPNQYKVFVDTAFYTADTVDISINTATPNSIELHTNPKFGMSPVEINVVDSAALQPIANFDVAVSYRASSQSNFINAGTEKTDASGKIIISLPWPSTVKAKIANTDVYRADSTVVSNSDDIGTALTLKVPTLSGINVNVFDFVDKQYVQGANVQFSIKKEGESTFTLLDTKTVTETGKVDVFATFPSELRVEIANHKFFKDTVFNINVVKYGSYSANAPLYLKPPAYIEPVMTNLQVTSLPLNNGITLSDPQDVVTDKKGNIYITDGNSHRVIRVDASGNTKVLAGSGTAGKADGVGTAASFAFPYGIKVANDGSVYVANNNGSGSTAFHSVRKIAIAPNGVGTVSTIAGSGSSGGADGIGVAATFNRPSGLAIDKANKYLYTAEWGGHRIRRIDLATNQVTFVAGAGTTGTVAGVGADAKFNTPWGIALDEANENLYVASWNGVSVSKIRLNDNTVTLIRNGSTTNFKSPRGIYVSSQGKIVVTAFDNPSTGTGHYLSMVNALNETGTSSFSLVAGATAYGDVLGGTTAARFNSPQGIWYDRYTGNWYVVDLGNKKIKIIRSNDI